MLFKDITRFSKLAFQENDPLFATALRHTSSNSGASYERLEFLGDRILGLCIAEMLYRLYPDSAEGGLAKRHAELVSASCLSEIGLALKIDKDIDIQGNLPTVAIRADVMEAIIGFLYITGGMTPCQHFIEHFWQPLAQAMQSPPDNPRSQLQEWAMQNRLSPPNYLEIARTGSQHAPEFCFEVHVKGLGSAQGWGKTKQTAKSAAAAELIKEML